MRNFYLTILCTVFSLINFNAKAQHQKPTKFAHFKLVKEVPSIAEQMRKGILKRPSYERGKEINPKKRHGNNVVPGKGLPKGVDPVIQPKSKYQSRTYVPEPKLVFDANIAQATPSDPTGAIGINHYVAAWNIGFQIFDKSGNALTDEAALGTLFSGNNAGDPIVIYDAPADRFIITEFEDGDDPGFNNGINVAVCKGSDPVNDGWYIYTSFDTGAFPDYPKYSVWHDGYYITANISTTGAGATGESVFVLEREELLAGAEEVQMVGFELPGLSRNGFYSPQFFNVGGGDLPASGPNTVVYMQDDSWGGVDQDHLKLWSVAVDWETPANSTISQPLELSTQPFNSVFDGGSFSNLSQPQGPDIDAMQATVMNQAQYRKFNGYNATIFNFVVDAGGENNELAGIRWYELRQDAEGQPWEIFQESTYLSPSGANAFAASMVFDKNGYIGMGYSTVSATTPVTINYTGRYTNDPLNVMSVPETRLAQSTGFSNSERYADYTHLTLDPSNGEDFWFISEYFNPSRADVVGVFKLAADVENDLQIVDIISPETGDLGASESITVVIRNNGSQPQTNFNLSYKVNDGEVVTETYTGTAIAFNETVQFTFAETTDLSIDGNFYSITALTELAADADTSNDSFIIEVQNLFENDLGVTEIISPVSDQNIEDGQEVSVEITNFGSAPQSGFPILYTFNGDSPVVETFTDEIEPGETSLYTFETTVSFDGFGDYNLEATTQLNSDSNPSNDTFTTVITKSFCEPESDCAGFNDGVTSLSLGDTNVAAVECSATGYSDNTDLIISVDIEESSISGTLQVGFTGTEYAIFVDLNQDNSFTQNELVDTGLVNSANTDFEFTLDLPNDIALGDYKMRVRGNDINFEGDATDPCDDLEYGRTNDYVLRIFSSLSNEENIFDTDELTIVERDQNIFNITLKTNKVTEDMELSVHTILGQRVVNNWISNSNGVYNYDLNMSFAQDGIYIVRIGNQNGGISKKIIVK